MMKIRKSTSFWAFCIMFLLLCVLPGSAFAADITVYLTVGAGGELQRAADGSVMAYKPVTVPEGATVQDVIAKAHNDYLGGTEGFAVESDVIKKLWNKTVADPAKNFFIIEVNPNKNLNSSNLTARKAEKNPQCQLFFQRKRLTVIIILLPIAIMVQKKRQLFLQVME